VQSEPPLQSYRYDLLILYAFDPTATPAAATKGDITVTIKPGRELADSCAAREMAPDAIEGAFRDCGYAAGLGEPRSDRRILPISVASAVEFNADVISKRSRADTIVTERPVAIAASANDRMPNRP
jgi:hypothetical protein